MILVVTVGLFAITANAVVANTETVSGLSSVCDGVNHIYNNKIISAQYLKSEATCVDRAVYYYSCSCGEKGEETFTSGSPLGHSYNTAVVENLPNGDSLGNTYQICLRCSYKNAQSLASCSMCEGDGKIPQLQDCPKCIGGYLLCERCGGSGKETKYTYTDTCNSCGGSGKWGSAGNLCIACNGTGEREYLYDCFQCDGDGTTGNYRCSNCNETGKITVEVNCTNCSGKGYHKHIEIQFNFLGGSSGPATQISTNNKLTISSKKPVKSGYIFVGWNTLENDQTIYQPGGTYAGDSTTFFAVWVPACTECGGRGYFTSQYKSTKCSGVGSYYKDTYRCRDCGTTNKINHVVGYGRVCGNCGSWDVSYVGSYSVDCGCENGVSQSTTNCTACSATGRDKVVAPILISKSGTQVELLLIEGFEYSMNGTTWQSSNIFTGLSPTTTYTFYQRVANNGTIPFGATSEALTVMTACASDEAHNKNSKCVCTICGIESHSLNENCICTACGAEKHALDKNCICISCGIEKHSLDAECICTECGAEKHDLSAHCVCLACGTTFHQFESDTCSVCHNSKTDWDGSVATSFESGSGTSADPYIISTGTQLAFLADQVNAGTTYKDCYFELANDIDLKGIDWIPIGTNLGYYFAGNFNGKGYLIHNLTITKSYRFVGLFGYINQATISNIGVENININSTYSSSMSAVGGLIGVAQETTISNCYTKGTVYGINSSYETYVGGLIGELDYSSSITNSYTNTTVMGEIKSLYSKYNVFVGGLIGGVFTPNSLDMITIETCYVIATVKSINHSNYQWAESGGLIGLSNGYGMVNISKCFLECSIFALGSNTLVDGFVANIPKSNTTFKNCYYAYINIGSYYSGISTSTTENFKSQIWLSDTLGWDFSDTWAIANNQYPILKDFCRHSYGDWYEVQAPTCTATGTEEYECSVCQHKETRMTDAKGHTNAEAVVENKVDANCTVDGSYDSVVYCSVCDAELSREAKTIDKLGHDYETKWTTDVEPTCTTVGSKSHHCTRCGDKADITEVPATNGHSYGNWHTVVAPTCTATGTDEHECSVCHKKETRTIDAKGHTNAEAVVENKVDATCTADGSCDSVFYCSVCNAELSREVKTIEKLGHDYTNACDAYCNTCGYVRTITHSYKTEWSGNVEKHWYECSVCGDKLSEASHTPGAEATETTNQVCTVCGFVIQEALGHTHDYNNSKNDDTNHWKECACGEKNEITAHTWNNGEVTKEATVDEEGAKTYTCTLCSCTNNESIAKLVTNVKDTESGVTLEIPSNSQATLPAGTVIEVLEKSNESISEQILGEFATTAETVVEALGVYDLNLLLDGVKIQPNGAVVVTLPAPKFTAEYDRIIVVFIADDGSYDECKTTVNADGTISFETDHFSKYAVIGVNEEEADDRIGVGAIIAIVVGAVLVVGGGAFAIYRFIIAKKRKTVN